MDVLTMERRYQENSGVVTSKRGWTNLFHKPKALPITQQQQKLGLKVTKIKEESLSLAFIQVSKNLD